MQATRTIAAGLKRGDLVLFRSTHVPGTIENRLLPILQTSGLVPGVDFHVAYAPERIAEGQAFEEFRSMPIIVAGINDESTRRAVGLLKRANSASMHVATNILTAEFTKVAENVQRDVNIAMIQELARLAEALNVDIFEVVSLANTHSRVNLLTPGPGVGGYCIPNAYHYMAYAAQTFGVSLPLLQQSRVINDSVPSVVVRLVERALGEHGKSLSGARVALLGLAMKDNSSDLRLSPAIEVANQLMSKGAIIAAFDPVVPHAYDYQSPSLDDCLEGADAVLVLAKQAPYGYSDVRSRRTALATPPIIVDTRNLIPKEDALKDGFILYSI